MTRNTALAIMHIYPEMQPLVDFIVEQDLDGIQTITFWNSTNEQPTEQQLDNAWLDVCKQQKKALLSVDCGNAIVGGFTSSALGSAHTYPSDEEAQRNFHSELDRINLDSTYTEIYFKTLDSGYMAHTIDQFKQVFVDGHTFGRSQITKLNQLKEEVDAATTKDEVEAIQW